MSTLRALRDSIQRDVDEYFDTPIEISARAMAAMQGSGSDADSEHDLPAVTALSVFHGLLASSPACLIALHNAGIDTTHLTTPSWNVAPEEPICLHPDALNHFFHGTPDEDPTRSHLRDNSDALEAVRRCIRTSKTLDEAALFRAFLIAAYSGPSITDRYLSDSELRGLCTDVGLLLQSSSIDRDEGLVELRTRDESYLARIVQADRFRDLVNLAATFDTCDPNHGQFQFALYLDSKKRVRVRPFGFSSVGVSGPEFLESGSTYQYRDGIFQPAHVIGAGISQFSIAELEGLMNRDTTSEAEYQRFFERHPFFLTACEYQKAHPHLVLCSDENSEFIPDFFLEPLSSGFCDILELKLPAEKLVRTLQSGRRQQFRSFVQEAVSQLIEYQRFFDERRNRQWFHSTYGLEAYRPRMILVIGRNSAFRSPQQRRELEVALPSEVSLLTYDDLLDRARTYVRYATSRFDGGSGVFGT